ncbi:TetR family transcriptional regulator [Cellulomonas sp. JZ18]|uniref:TetR/AcrR family transcriptional regulator n=1 Tax=Cellulomonas sp. JZ18 TaxID=2654191 RepID=UPI0012D437FA|nr:TetR/AcrR family transcriptional regulator [Cellulomonas sp. JZ18]QGQ18014.1 TetR family transcriptional regulator [Cellulomonas sp. JZ18]
MDDDRSTPTTADDDPAARREAERARRDREKAERAAQKEAERARRDAEQARRQAEKDERDARRAAERRERERARADAERAKEDEQRRREREREAADAAREAARALREAEQADRAAALARRRAVREAEKARRQAERADPDVATPPDLADLPPDLAVLWRGSAPARRGPRPGLSLEQIADAGIALADAEGLEAVSMARLAESLGFTTMSLYRYVTSKDEVLMLMADRAAGRPPHVGPEVGGWRERTELLLELQRPVLAAHPWLARTTSTIFAVGPNRLAWMDAMLACLEDTRLTEPEKLSVVGVLSSHQLDWARLIDAYTVRERAAGDDEPADPDAVIARLVDPATQPALARAVAGGALDPAAAPPGPTGTGLDFGTRVILDGIAALVERRAQD